MTVKNIAFVLLVLLTACKSKRSGQVSISADHQQGAVVVSGLAEAALYGLKKDSMSVQAWQTLLMISKMPADAELRETAPAQPGRYQLLGNKIVFKPDTPFVKGATYYVRYCHFDDGLTGGNMITDKRKPGRTPYTELIFKY